MPPPALAEVAVAQLVVPPDEPELPEAVLAVPLAAAEELDELDELPHAAIVRLAAAAMATGTARWRSLPAPERGDLADMVLLVW
jgi:hypothetical protein